MSDTQTSWGRVPAIKDGFATVYFKDPETGEATGEPIILHKIDALHAVRNFPEQWAYEPWPRKN